jgi:hypothetical protein
MVKHGLLAEAKQEVHERRVQLFGPGNEIDVQLGTLNDKNASRSLWAK